MTELADVEFVGPDTVRLTGEIDMSNARLVERRVEWALERAGPSLIVDLSEVTYLDSAGLRMVFVVSRHAGRRHKRLALVVPEASPLRRVLEIADVPAFVPTRRGVEEARGALAAAAASAQT